MRLKLAAAAGVMLQDPSAGGVAPPQMHRASHILIPIGCLLRQSSRKARAGGY